jgi:hypothetical protein
MDLLVRPNPAAVVQFNDTTPMKEEVDAEDLLSGQSGRRADESDLRGGRGQSRSHLGHRTTSPNIGVLDDQGPGRRACRSAATDACSRGAVAVRSLDGNGVSSLTTTRASVQ